MTIWIISLVESVSLLISTYVCTSLGRRGVPSMMHSLFRHLLLINWAYQALCKPWDSNANINPYLRFLSLSLILFPCIWPLYDFHLKIWYIWKQRLADFHWMRHLFYLVAYFLFTSGCWLAGIDMEVLHILHPLSFLHSHTFSPDSHVSDLPYCSFDPFPMNSIRGEKTCSINNQIMSLYRP